MACFFLVVGMVHMHNPLNISLFAWSCWGRIQHIPSVCDRVCALSLTECRGLSLQSIILRLSSHCCEQWSCLYSRAAGHLAAFCFACHNGFLFSKKMVFWAADSLMRGSFEKVCLSSGYCCIVVRLCFGTSPPFCVGINARCCSTCKSWLGTLDLSF